jgi:hypothetical protein
MWWSFRKSKKVAPGVRLTVSKGGPSVSVGRKGARVSVGRRGARTSFKLGPIRFGGKPW